MNILKILFLVLTILFFQGCIVNKESTSSVSAKSAVATENSLVEIVALNDQKAMEYLSAGERLLGFDITEISTLKEYKALMKPFSVDFDASGVYIVCELEYINDPIIEKIYVKAPAATSLIESVNVVFNALLDREYFEEFIVRKGYTIKKYLLDKQDDVHSYVFRYNNKKNKKIFYFNKNILYTF